MPENQLLWGFLLPIYINIKDRGGDVCQKKKKIEGEITNL
jgi:hypothetical protein